jgi:cytochrome P450
MEIDDFDHRAPEFIADPHPVLRSLQEQGAVLWSPRLKAWLVTRHADVRAGFRDQRLSSDRIRPFLAQVADELRALVGPLCDGLARWQVFNDAPRHARLRALVGRAFTATVVEALRPQISGLVDGLLDDLGDGREPLDFHRRFAYPLPALLIAHMLDMPASDIDRLKAWSDDIAQFVLTSRNDPERYRKAAAGFSEMTQYFDAFVRRRPAEGGGKDLTSSMLEAQRLDDSLTHEDIVANLLSVLFAGHETTTTLLTNGLHTLLKHPDALRLLRDSDEDSSAVGNLVEELLRYEGPALAMARIAATNFEWAGKTLRTGDRVFLVQAAANRDPRVFPNPDRFDVTRSNAIEHLTFGFGFHSCAGSQLARWEARIALTRLAKRFPAISLSDTAPQWSDAFMTRALRELLVIPEPRARQ